MDSLNHELRKDEKRRDAVEVGELVWRDGWFRWRGAIHGTFQRSSLQKLLALASVNPFVHDQNTYIGEVALP